MATYELGTGQVPGLIPVENPAEEVPGHPGGVVTTDPLDRESGAGYLTRAVVGATGGGVEGQLQTLKNMGYADAQHFGKGNFIFTDPTTGKRTLYNPAGFDMGDLAEWSRAGVQAVTSTLATGAGFSIGGPPGAVAAAGLGDVAGGELFDAGARALGMEDPRTGGERLRDMGVEFAMGAGGQKLGPYIGAGIRKGAGAIFRGSSRGIAKAGEAIADLERVGIRAGAKPRMGKKLLEFESDLDRAFYIIANPKTKSKHHADYMKALQEFTGWGVEEIMQGGQVVRRRVTALAKGSEELRVKIPKIAKVQDAVPVGARVTSDFPLAGDIVDGLEVGEGVVKNTDSISASLLPDHEVQKGIRTVPMSVFDNTAPRDLFYAVDDLRKVDALAEQILESGRIDPIIVVIDKDGAYILEGAHRIGALHKLGKKEFPALVVHEGAEPVTKAAPTPGAAKPEPEVVPGKRVKKGFLGSALEFLSRDAKPSLTVGQATGTRFAQGLEVVLSRVPGGAGRFAKVARETNNAIAEFVEKRAAEVSGRAAPDPETAGRVLKQGLIKFLDWGQDTSEALFVRLNRYIKPEQRVSARNAQAAATRLLNRIPGAPATSEALAGPTKQFSAALTSDIAGATRWMDRGTVPFAVLSGLRTEVGRKLATKGLPLPGDIPRADLRQFYAALSEDMEIAAEAASPAALKAFKRANKFYSAYAQRVDDFIEPLMKKTSPEDIFRALELSSRKGATTIRTLRRSMNADEWRVVVGTVVSQLGRAKPGKSLAEEASEAAGDVFSVESFLTNWNSLRDRSKDALFGGTSLKGLRGDLDALARITSRLRESGRVFANPPGTAAGMTGTGLFVGGTASVFMGAPAFLGALTATTVGANATARLMTNPKFVRWLAQGAKLQPNRWGAHIGRLTGIAAGSDPETREAIREYIGAFADLGEEESAGEGVGTSGGLAL